MLHRPDGSYATTLDDGMAWVGEELGVDASEWKVDRTDA